MTVATVAATLAMRGTEMATAEAQAVTVARAVQVMAAVMTVAGPAVTRVEAARAAVERAAVTEAAARVEMAMIAVLWYVSCAQLFQIDLCSGRRKKRVDTGVESIERRCANGVCEERTCCAASTQCMPATSAGARSARIITSRVSARLSRSSRPRGRADDESQMTQ